ncbi:MAG: transcriptional repressor NrdR [Deltaproteobacteria bacterium]|jgi:transcriptional repressor NrdR|nr:transcriptional repressor NrdR [Pseudomonadota bacterium]MBW2222285.1 transcriptional repressor NrdR [Deltaproteobacteria bacterium]MBW2553878.1 transcriptional repressor NrdR [Deltaproteobacteria bacterium]MBW2652729.1 transcriptional repressor NrdR [Deltaproteobacteria bacterium]MCK5010988.1 transcriptional repressor NrdR [Deltaproteobacteria bacterium]
MKCPFCTDLDNKVIDSRLSKDGTVVRRRRECISCHRRFTTHERVEDIMPVVIKKDGRREIFDKSKMLSGVQKACSNRPVSMDDIEDLVDRVERYFQDRGDKEINCTEVGEIIMRELHQLDEVAYVRFASVYRQFKDISDFMTEVKELLSTREQRVRKKGQKGKDV